MSKETPPLKPNERRFLTKFMKEWGPAIGKAVRAAREDYHSLIPLGASFDHEQQDLSDVKGLNDLERREVLAFEAAIARINSFRSRPPIEQNALRSQAFVWRESRQLLRLTMWEVAEQLQIPSLQLQFLELGLLPSDGIKRELVESLDEILLPGKETLAKCEYPSIRKAVAEATLPCTLLR